MKSRNALFLLFLGVTMMTKTVSGGTPQQLSSQPLVRPQPGVPVSFDMVEEHYRKIVDGSLAVNFVLTGQTYRDSAGRVRIESETRDAAGNLTSSDSVLLDEPSNLCIIFSKSDKTALRIPWPVSASTMNFLGDVGGDEPTQKWKVASEKLEERTIEGVQFSGTRIKSTGEDDQSLVKTFESWYSNDLKMFGAISITGPKGSIEIRIQNLHRQEQDAVLFQIPSEYKIIDVPLPMPASGASDFGK